MSRWFRNALAWIRDRWRAAGAMDRRLDRAKHDPAITKDADYEQLKRDGRAGPFL